MFFALFEDLSGLIEEIESLVDIEYYKMGSFISYDMAKVRYSSISDIPNKGFVPSGDWNRVDSYLIIKKGTQINIETVPQRKGGNRYIIGQKGNQKSVELKLGGIYQEANITLVAGRIATASPTSASSELYKIFSAKIKKKFKRIGPFYVGESAEARLKQGWRLVTNDKLSKEHDLTLD